MPEETLPKVADLAPTCVAAGIEEAKLQSDLRPKDAPVNGAEKPDDASVRCAYGWLVAGASVPSAAKQSCLDEATVSTIKSEIDAAKNALKDVPPPKPEPIAAEAEQPEKVG